MRIGSLFSGIGGLELGLEWAIPNAHTVFQVESNPFARSVLARHWPTVRRFEDVREVGAHNLPACDLLCGGFPCQDISVAGTGAGLDGDRSGLWFEYARIIRDLHPRYIVVENVTALLARGMGRVVGDLAASGYDCVWDCVPASAIGAPHRRDRIFIIGWRNMAHPHRTGLQGRFSQCLQECTGERTAGQGGTRARKLPDYWRVEPDVGRVASGVPSRVDRLRCLGNAVVPQVAEVIGRVVAAIDSGVEEE